MQEMWVRFLGQEDPPEEAIVTPSSILAWEIPWTEEPGMLQTIESEMIEQLNMYAHPQHACLNSYSRLETFIIDDICQWISDLLLDGQFSNNVKILNFTSFYSIYSLLWLHHCYVQGLGVKVLLCQLL